MNNLKNKGTFTVSLALLALLVLASTAFAGTKLEAIATGGMGEDDAVLELTPELKSNGDIVVRFAANTHNVDLSEYDLKKIVTLEIGGKLIVPAKADRLRGHHAFGKIVFRKVGAKSDSFKVVVNGIPAIEKRVYQWNGG